MTVTTTSNTVIFQGNGATVAFPFNFAMPGVSVSQAALDLVVTFVNAAGTSSVVAFGPGVTQYQLTLNSPVFPNPTGVGGTVNYNPSGVPIPLGSSLSITRVLPDVQAVSLQNQGTLWQPVIEQALDYLTMSNQQIADQVGNAIQAPLTDPPGLNYVVPSVASRANQGLIFDSQGNVTTGALPASGVISAAMAPVVGAATLPAARTAMGLGNIATQNIAQGLQNDGAGGVRVNMPLTADVGPTVIVNSTFHMGQRVTVAAVNATVQYVLPKATTLFNAFSFRIFAQNPVLLTPNAADSIGGAPFGQSIPIPQDSAVWLSTDSIQAWYVTIDSPVAFPGGYLTVVPPLGSALPLAADTLLPLQSMDVANLWYRADVGNWVPIFTGSAFVQQQFNADLQLALDGTHVNGSVYDVFAFVSGIVGIGAGPAWRQPGIAITNIAGAPQVVTTAANHNLLNGDQVVVSGAGSNNSNGGWTISGVTPTTFTLNGSAVVDSPYVAGTGIVAGRGIGSNTTQLQRIAGVYTNAVQIVLRNFNGPFTIAPGQATYLGTFAPSATAQVTCKVAWGSAVRQWGVWNAYNRKPVRLLEGDPAVSWTYTAAALQVANNNTQNRIQIVVGLPEEIVDFTYAHKGSFHMSGAISLGGGGKAAISFTSGTAPPTLIVPSGFVDDKVQWQFTTPAVVSDYIAPQTFNARYITRPFIGIGIASPLTAGTASGTTTWYGGESSMLFSAIWRC